MPELPSRSDQTESLYIHVPFCARKCEYCAFYSEAMSGEWTQRYVGALVRELEHVAAQLRPRTIFFGGGTPSLLHLRQWEAILEAMARLHLLGAAEWTVECNPATVSADKAKLLRDYGVNRISMGVQSLNESLLERLGRVHTRAMVFKSFDLLRRAGFDNLNLDLMFAIPGQTMSIWQETLAEALALGSEHLSCYEVIYEEDTPLFAQLHSGKVHADEDLACAMYEELIDRAGASGLSQYEIANFARYPVPGAKYPVSGDADQSSHTAPGTWPLAPDTWNLAPGTTHLTPDTSGLTPDLACLHNLNYWRGGAFHGLGPSATSYVGGVRTRNTSNTRHYCEQLETGGCAVEFREELSPLARAGETAAFGLRMVAGWGFEEFQRVTGQDMRGEWAAEMAELCDRGWGRMTAERFRLTREGLRFADAAAELFLR
jgi:coproporphyrinogen III oxidase-like Fe-S oxidoreductase